MALLKLEIDDVYVVRLFFITYSIIYFHHYIDALT